VLLFLLAGISPYHLAELLSVYEAESRRHKKKDMLTAWFLGFFLHIESHVRKGMLKRQSAISSF